MPEHTNLCVTCYRSECVDKQARANMPFQMIECPNYLSCVIEIDDVICPTEDRDQVVEAARRVVAMAELVCGQNADMRNIIEDIIASIKDLPDDDTTDKINVVIGRHGESLLALGLLK